MAELVKNIRIIALQDSLLRLGNMSDSELESTIERLIDKARTAEEEKKVVAANNPTQQLQNQPKPTGTGSITGTGWYFYNTTALSFGANDFRTKWGTRPNEDNWRRKEKRALNAPLAGEDGDTNQVTAEQLLDPEFYKKNIPRTKEQKDSANVKIQNAYYDLGTIYKEQLNENQRSIKTFEELLKRYPRGKWNLETYYQLYRLYKDVGDERSAQDYANRILKEFPESEYAKILKDPKYLEKLEVMRGRLGQMYDMAFQNYERGDFERVIEAADSALTLFRDGKILPKFALLRAMAIGSTEKLPVYRLALEDFIARYTAAAEKPLAEELLEYVKSLMGESVPDEPVKEETKTETAPPATDEYVYDEAAVHYYTLIVANLPDMALTKGLVSDFNSRVFANDNLTIKNLKLSQTEDLIFVQGFTDTKKAMDYYRSMLADTTVLAGIDLQTVNQFVISQENFTKFYKKREIEPYVQFFITRYILKKD